MTKAGWLDAGLGVHYVFLAIYWTLAKNRLLKWQANRLGTDGRQGAMTGPESAFRPRSKNVHNLEELCKIRVSMG
jgi:hypothetical protein